MRLFRRGPRRNNRKKYKTPPSRFGKGAGGLGQSHSVTLSFSGGAPILCRFGAARPTKTAKQGFSSALPLGMALLIVMGAITLSVFGASTQEQSRFTQFWGLLSQENQITQIHLGVENHESSTQNYQVVLQTGSSTLFQQSGVILLPGERWEKMVPLPELKIGRVDALLYRQEDPDEVFRQVILRLEP